MYIVIYLFIYKGTVVQVDLKFRHSDCDCVFWVKTLCRFVDVYQSFGETCLLYLYIYIEGESRMSAALATIHQITPSSNSESTVQFVTILSLVLTTIYQITLSSILKNTIKLSLRYKLCHLYPQSVCM